MPAPALPLTVPDLVGFDDMDLFASETTSDLQTLEQDVYHVLIELPGSNLDDPDRGVGVLSMLSGPTTNLDALTSRIETELEKDDRIDAVSATLTAIHEGGLLPDGSTMPAPGGWLLEVDVNVDGSVLGLAYSVSSATGLVPQ